MDGGQPRIVDVAYKLVYRPETPNIPYHHPDLRPFIGNATPSPTTIQTDGFLTGKPLGYSLTLVYNDNFVAENKPVNLCVESLRDRPGYMWRDNVLGFRNTEPADRTAQFDDATEDDVRVFTKYLTQGGDGRDAGEFFTTAGQYGGTALMRWRKRPQWMTRRSVSSIGLSSSQVASRR
ncbi:hypothetical protein FKP32DRAFT_1592922 [Trametes sanguinea]|nr:hypothetical protein FKP32DRAFT_1592922 [Trametes sanguinea]